MNKSREHAQLMLDKAAEDYYALERLIQDPQVSEAVIGFHAQQATEKLLKAVLTNRAIRYGRTHSLKRLLTILQKQGIPAPPEADKLPSLTPYAAEFRYDYLPPEVDGPRYFDRGWLLECVRRTRAWAESLIGAT